MALEARMQRDTIFISYSRADSSGRDALVKHLEVVLGKPPRIRIFADTSIETGEEWRNRIRDEMDRALVVVLLVSADFLTSDFVQSVEIPRAALAASRGEAVIACLYVRHCAADAFRIHVDDPNGKGFDIRVTDYQGLNAPNSPLMARKGAKREQLLAQAAGEIVELAETRRATETKHKAEEERRKQEAEAKAKEEAEAKAKEEAEARAKAEGARLKAEAEARAKAEAEAKAKEEAEARAEEASLKAEAEARAKADAEAKAKEEAEARAKAEEEARAKAEAEVKATEEAEARAKAEEARLKAETEARAKAEAEAKAKEEAEAKHKADEERRQREAEAKRKAEEERRQREVKAKRKAEEERRQREDQAVTPVPSRPGRLPRLFLVARSMLSTSLCKSWILRSMGGILLGLLVSFPVMSVLGERLMDVPGGDEVGASLCMFSLGGLGLTLAQWTMLKTRLSHAAWWIAGSLGWGLGAGYFGWSPPIAIWRWLDSGGVKDGIEVTTIFAWMMLLGGTTCGIIQWPLLRKRTGSRGWLWVGAVGCVVTLVVGLSTSLLLGVAGGFLGLFLGAAAFILWSGTKISSILSES